MSAAKCNHCGCPTPEVVEIPGSPGNPGIQGPAGPVITVTNDAATGGSQNLTATPAQALSTTLTLTSSASKTYLLSCYVRVDYVGATLAANQVVTLTLRRTNNTAGDIASSTLMTEIIPSPDIQYLAATVLTKSLGQIGVYSFPYTTVGVSDVIQAFISISVIPSVGNVNVVEASIIAVRLT